MAVIHLFAEWEGDPQGHPKSMNIIGPCPFIPSRRVSWRAPPLCTADHSDLAEEEQKLMTKNLQIIDQRRAEGGKSVATKRTDKIIDQCEFIRLNPRVRVIN